MSTRIPRIPKDELKMRLKRITAYNAKQLDSGQPHHCLSQRALDVQMEKWGYDPKLAEGVGYVWNYTTLG